MIAARIGEEFGRCGAFGHEVVGAHAKKPHAFAAETDFVAKRARAALKISSPSRDCIVAQ